MAIGMGHNLNGEFIGRNYALAPASNSTIAENVLLVGNLMKGLRI